MKQLLLISSLLLLLDVTAQIRELKAPKKANLETSYVDSLNILHSVYSDKDSTAIFQYDSGNFKWNFISSVYRGSQVDLVDLKSVSGWYGGAYVSGLKDTGGFAVMYYLQGTWKKLAKMVKNNLSTKGQLYHKFYRFNNDIYFVTNADSMVGVSNGHVFRVTPNGLINMNFSFIANEYHLTMKGDTLLLGAQTTLYSYNNPNWITYKQLKSPIGNFIKGLEYKFGKIHYIQTDTFVKRIFPSYTDSFGLMAQCELKSLGNKLYLLPTRYTYSSNIQYLDSSKGVLPAFRLKGNDTLPLQIASNGSKAYIYFQSNLPIIFGNVNMGRVAELEVSNYFVAYYDRIYLAPFLDHNRNSKLDAGDQIVSVDFKELDGNRSFINLAGQFYLYQAYDNEYICFIAAERIKTDSCYTLIYSGARCGNHYLSSRNYDTLYFPYQTDYNEAVSNVKIRVTQSQNCRLDNSTPTTVKIWRDDCSSNVVTGTIELTVQFGAVLTNFNPAYKTQLGNVYTFDFSIGPNSSQKFTFDIMYPSADFSYGMVEYVKASIVGTSNEATEDNTDSAEHRLRYSFDPNAKMCVPEGRVTYDMETIKFHIDFQNEGNDYAQRVVVVDTLSLNIPVYEFKMIGSSHNYKLSHKDNVVTWTFDNINLWPKSQSDKYSKGFIEFEAKVNGKLRVGDSITNSASIYFDQNEPIITNTSKVLRVTKLNEVYKSKWLDIYPNPVSDNLYIKNKTDQTMVIHIYDALGKEIAIQQIGASTEANLSTADWVPGIYIVYIEGYGSYRIVR